MQKQLPHSGRSKNGGTFFTMLIFIMMLVSTALMYYYFQRTRYLERQISAITTGGTLPKSIGNEVFGLLDSGSDNKTSRVGQATAESSPAVSAPKDTASELSSQAQLSINTDNPPATQTGIPMEQPSVVSTQFETTTTDNADAQTLPPYVENDTDQVSESNEAEIIQDKDRAGSSDNTTEAETDPKERIESLYDSQPPPVKVRSPRRN